MAKKAATRKRTTRSGRPARRSVATPDVLHSQAISKHADAIQQLAAALSSTAGARPAGSFQLESLGGLPPLTREQILQGIEGVFNTGRALKDDDEINAVLPGGPAKLVAMWEMFDNWPAFRQRGLSIGPNDLRFVKLVSELIGVIAWGLKTAMRR